MRCLVHVKRKFYETYRENTDYENAKTEENYVQKLFVTDNKADKMGYSVDERLVQR